MRANAPQLPGGGGGWAQLELTDAKQRRTFQTKNRKVRTQTLIPLSSFKNKKAILVCDCGKLAKVFEHACCWDVFFFLRA